MNSNDRQTLVDNFKDGKIQILVSIDVVSEGFDVENCYVAILLRPTQSEALYIQQVGRVLRPEPNKVAIVLDHVGNTKRHGFVDEIREYDLHQKAKTKRKGELAATVETCEVCFAVYRPQPICPVCGHKKEVRKREITYEDGELVKMKKELKLDEGDPLIEKSTGAKLYFYAWDDDQRKTGFQFSLGRKNPKAKCFTPAQFKDFCKQDLYGIHSKHTDYAKKKFTERFLSLVRLAEVEIDDIAVIRSEQQRRKKLEEWSCKTLKDWMRLAKKRGHNEYWAKKRWELSKKRKRKENYDDDDLFGF